MKILVITRHAISNYGSLLQAYATQKVLEKLGHQCEIIDYIREDESYWNHEKTLLQHKSKWNRNLVSRCIYLLLRQPESILSGKMFEIERGKYLNLTKTYTSNVQLEKDCPKADLYMTGSDQVWGPTENGSYDPAYCLAFTSGNTKRVAYAASFGRTDMSNETKAYYTKYLKHYSVISVREDSAITLLNQLGIQVEQVIDPTLLLTAEEWRELASDNITGKYVLMYQLHNDPLLGKYAKKIAREKKLPLLNLSTAFHHIVRPGKFIWNPNISRFLAYIDHADCLITDSFHGTAFAINLNTQFVEVLPNNNTGTRNQSMLKLLGLEGRVLNDQDDVALASKKIDFALVNRKIEDERQRSIMLLKKMLV